MMLVTVVQPQVYAEEVTETSGEVTTEQDPNPPIETTPPPPQQTQEEESQETPIEPEPQPEQPVEQGIASKETQPQLEQPVESSQPKQDSHETEKEQPKVETEKEDKDKEETKYPAMTLTANAGGVIVTLQAGEGSLPEGTTLKANVVGQAYVNAVENTIEAQGRTLTDAIAIDVTPIDKNGVEVQPKNPVTVTFSGANLNMDQEGSVEVFRVSDDASSVTSVSGSGSANQQTFTANHFTIYVAGASTRDPNGDGSNQPNSDSHQYVLEAGQTVTLDSSTSASTWGVESGSQYVSLHNTTRTSAQVTNNNQTATDQTVVIHHHRTTSTSIERFYITVKAQTHNVAFYLQDAGASSFEKVDETTVGNTGTVTDIPEYPAEKTVGNKTYAFDGWYEDQTCTQPASFTNITSDKNYYAKYSVEEHTVTFMLKDAGQSSFANVHESTVEDGEDVTDAPEYPAQKTVDGKSYTFAGWFTDQECTTPTDLTNIKADQTVYAKYTLDKHTVKFMLKDAGASEFQQVHESTVDSGSPVEDVPTYPAEKTVDDKTYEFAGWFTDQECTTPADLSSITSDQTVYARYAGMVKLTYHKNSGADEADIPTPHEVEKAAGSKITLGDGTRVGYELVSWNTEPDGSGDAYQPGSTFTMPEQDIDLYAQWSAGTVTVRYWRNYDASDPNVFLTDTDVLENDPHYAVTNLMPTRENYLFLGWSTTPNGDVEYEPKEYYTVGEEDVNLYAVWGPYQHETYLLTEELTAHGRTVPYNGEVQYMPEGCEETDNPQTYGPYKYEGWVRVGNKQGDHLHHIYAKTDVITTSGKEVGTYHAPIYAELYTHHDDTGEFEALNEYIRVNNNELKIVALDVTINTNSAEKLYDGTPLTSGGTYQLGDGEPIPFAEDELITLVSGEKIRIKTTGSQTEKGSSQNGYEIHWEDDGTTADPVNYNFKEGTIGTLTVYTNEVKYEKNAGSDAVSNMPSNDSDVESTAYTIPSNVPTRQHYDFVEWNTKRDGTGDSYNPDGTYTFEGDTHSVTFYAIWAPKVVNLIYDPNGGTFRGKTEPTVIEHDYDERIEIAEKATREHYTFKEWNTKQDGTGDTYTPGDKHEFEDDATLYAIWKVNKYTITYKDGEGGSVFEDQTFEEDYGKPTPTYTPTETKQYYTFDGWDPTPSETVEGDATYTAKWKKNECPDGHHQWDDGVVTKDPTCTEHGETFFTCTHCGETKTEDIPEALGHDWGDWETIKEPTCTEKGQGKRVCKRDSSHVETKDLDPLGHDWDDWKTTKEPTCTEKGEEKRVCKRDHSHVETRELPMKDHEPGNPVRENVKEPTCTEPGSYDEVVYCKHCHKELSRKTIKTDPLGHDWSEWQVVKKATENETGQEVHVCKRCGHKEYRTTPKTKVTPVEVVTGVITNPTTYVTTMGVAILGLLGLVKRRFREE